VGVEVSGYYASVAVIADKMSLSGDATGRAVHVMGKWQRFHKEELIWLDDAEGHPRALTPKQYQVLTMALDMIEGVGLTMREMAHRLEVAPSTVSRALTKLAAWGLIAYVVGRGRWAGLVIFRRAPI
jgi:DNA-binding NarL/FixJ family response regulator